MPAEKEAARGRRLAALGILLSVLAASVSIRPTVADTNPPAGSVLYPTPGAWVTTDDVGFAVEFTDPDGVGQWSISMELDGVVLEVTSSPVGTSTTDVRAYGYAIGVAEGLHTVVAAAMDELMNGPAILTWSFSVDTVPPVVAFTHPLGNPVLPNGSVVLAWNGSDSGSGIDRYEVRLDNGSWIDVGNATAFPFQGLAPGVHTVSLRAYDVAGNAVAQVPVEVVTVPSPPLPTDLLAALVITLAAIGAAGAAAIAWPVLRRRRGPPGGGKPS